MPVPSLLQPDPVGCNNSSPVCDRSHCTSLTWSRLSPLVVELVVERPTPPSCAARQGKAIVGDARRPRRLWLPATDRKDPQPRVKATFGDVSVARPAWSGEHARAGRALGRGAENVASGTREQQGMRAMSERAAEGRTACPVCFRRVCEAESFECGGCSGE